VKLRLLLAAGVVMIASSGARAQATPDAEHGRYSFAPIADGVLRLDTQTGSVTNCSKQGTGWACLMVPDERAAVDAEIGRLQADNRKLTDQLAAREQAAAGDPNAPKAPDTPDQHADRGNRLVVPLPDDRDIDRAVGFLERAWRRLIDLADRMQRDVSGKI
jgi:hypothetical protein